MNFRTNIQTIFTLLALTLTTACMNEPIDNNANTTLASDLGHAELGIERADGRTERVKAEPQTGRCIHGTCTPTFPKDCLEILENNVEALDGTYIIDPDGEGTMEVECDMTNGGWTGLSAEYLSSLNNIDRRYLFTKNNNWIVTPSTTKVWSWESAQLLPGHYFYGQSGADAEGFIACDVPALAASYASYGVGCFLIPTDGWKVFPQGGYDDQNGTTGLCQNTPSVFGDDYCTNSVQIWERRDI
jgi:hypothetical protein